MVVSNTGGRSLVTYYILQDFRLDKNNESSLIIHGIRKDLNRDIRVERKVNMSIAQVLDENTVVLNIKKIQKTTNDELNEESFSHLLADIGRIGDTIRLDIVSLNNGSYLIGNSTAFNLICVSY